jgi:hypothetical protein
MLSSQAENPDANAARNELCSVSCSAAILVVLEECTDALAVVYAADGLEIYVLVAPTSHGSHELTSANTLPTSSTSSFGHRFWCSLWSTVFVTTTLSSALALILSIASPLSTP